jgi:hypothetical protein
MLVMVGTTSDSAFLRLISCRESKVHLRDGNWN